ncbi:MAG: efflux RND transporter periplasmic adaptor subunit [Syntrophobacteraceae bacterium]|nr:efflux RND transporter periplasmic adaptor subunit [Desulfobacteraceae bacterium]
MKRKAALLPLHALALLVVLASCSPEKKAEQTAGAPVPVRVGTVRHIQDRELISVSGTVASPDAPSNVSFLVSGKVIRVGPREGEYAEKGQFLASIEATDYELSLKAASAQTRQAAVALERAADEYGRMKFLFDSMSLPANDFQKFKAARDAARQQLEAAKANEGIARKRLSDATLLAPVSGFVSKRSVEPGEIANPGRPAFEIVKLDPVEIQVGVPETDVHIVRVGQKAEILLPAVPGQSFEGTVRVVNVSAEPSTRTFMTRISVSNPRHVLRVGMVAEARIRGDRTLDLMTLPIEAIVRDPQGATVVFVYYPEEKRVYAKRVATGTVHGTEMEIRSGLSGGEPIVLAGQEKLRDGTVVSIVSGDGSNEQSDAVREKGAGK